MLPSEEMLTLSPALLSAGPLKSVGGSFVPLSQALAADALRKTYTCEKQREFCVVGGVEGRGERGRKVSVSNLII